MNKKELKISLVLNVLIFVLVLLGTIFMIIGFKFMHQTNFLAISGLGSFKYFTVDSNVFVAIASLLLIIYESLLLKKKINAIPNFVYILKYIGTIGVTLTFLVTLFYLTPTLGSKFWFLYQNSNLFFHLLVPILSFISYAFFEKVNVSFKSTFLGVSTMLVYGVYYVTNVLIHQKNGQISTKYDIYGFARGGVKTIFIVFLTILLITYFSGFLLYKINKRKN